MSTKIILTEDQEKAAEYLRGNTVRIYLYSDEGEFLVKALSVLLGIKIARFIAVNSNDEGFLEVSLNTYVGKFILEMLVLYLARDRNNDGVIYLLKEKSGVNTYD